MADNEYGLANNFASQYGSNTSLNKYEDLLTGKLPGANVQTPSSAFQGAYTGILKDTGQTGTSTNPMDFQAGSVNKAIWADEKGINELGIGTGTGDGLGNYGTYTNSQGQTVGLDKNAYNAINDGGAIDGTLAQGNVDWGYKEWGTAGNLGLGAGQLGLGLASYFDQSKTAKAQRNLLNQQYASNAEAITDRRANKEALSKIVIK